MANKMNITKEVLKAFLYIIALCSYIAVASYMFKTITLTFNMFETIDFFVINSDNCKTMSEMALVGGCRFASCTIILILLVYVIIDQHKRRRSNGTNSKEN